MMARRVVFTDLDADPPVWPWGMALPQLATRTQLRRAGLRPGRQPIAGLVLWPSRRGGRPRTTDGFRYAYLYRIDLARPRLQLTAAHAAAAAKATAARRICPECGHDPGYQPSRRLGCCNDCAVAPAAAA
jgi:hypothetical protein